jgi:hypothetical protein
MAIKNDDIYKFQGLGEDKEKKRDARVSLKLQEIDEYIFNLHLYKPENSCMAKALLIDQLKSTKLQI